MTPHRARQLISPLPHAPTRAASQTTLRRVWEGAGVRGITSAFVAFAIFTLLLTGCTPRTNSPFANLTPQQARDLARQMNRDRADALDADLRQAFATRPPANILILSGGDAHGAFGCGVLAGWRDAPGGRPTFDVVTGVSTGALMATFAFLGHDADDATLRDVYTHLRDRDVMDGPFTPGPPDSVFDTRPLRALIARRVTPDAIRRVADAHHHGRRLYVATVDLDTGASVIWPLSRIAADAVDGNSAEKLDAGVKRFRNILLAAASIPVLFPPVEIDGGLHVDAGIREAIFLRQAMLGLAHAYDDSIATNAQPRPSPPTVWAVVNGTLQTQPQAVDDDLLHIGARSLDLYTQSLQVFNLRDAAHLAAAHTPPFQFNWIAEPKDLDDPPGPGLFSPMFDPPVMTHLYTTGQSLGRDPRAWRRGLPALDVENINPPATMEAHHPKGNLNG